MHSCWISDGALKPSEAHAVQSSGSKPKSRNEVVVLGSVVRTVELAVSAFCCLPEAAAEPAELVEASASSAASADGAGDADRDRASLAAGEDERASDAAMLADSESDDMLAVRRYRAVARATQPDFQLFWRRR